MPGEAQARGCQEYLTFCIIGGVVAFILVCVINHFLR